MPERFTLNVNPIREFSREFKKRGAILPISEQSRCVKEMVTFQPDLVVELYGVSRRYRSSKEISAFNVGVYFGWESIPGYIKEGRLRRDNLQWSRDKLRGRDDIYVWIDQDGKIKVNFNFTESSEVIAKRSDEFHEKMKEAVNRFSDPNVGDAFEAGIASVIVPFIL